MNKFKEIKRLEEWQIDFFTGLEGYVHLAVFGHSEEAAIAAGKSDGIHSVIVVITHASPLDVVAEWYLHLKFKAGDEDTYLGIFLCLLITGFFSF